MNKFESTQAYKKGRAGEVNVIEQLLERGIELKDYTDYQEHKFKQKKGFDVEVFNKRTQEWDRADIKTNIRNGFTFLEVIKHPAGTLGWFYTSKADSILTYDLDNNHCYIYDLNEMRNYVKGRNFKLCGKNKDLFALPVNSNYLIRQLF